MRNDRIGVDPEGVRGLVSVLICRVMHEIVSSSSRAGWRLAAAIAVALGGAPALAGLLKGPYLLDMTPTSVRVRMEADALLDAEVRFWPEGDPSAARTFLALPEPIKV